MLIGDVTIPRLLFYFDEMRYRRLSTSLLPNISIKFLNVRDIKMPFTGSNAKLEGIILVTLV